MRRSSRPSFFSAFLLCAPFWNDVSVLLLNHSFNECEGNHSYHVNATCMNTLGSHVYECHPGYAGNEQNCTGEFYLFPKYSWHNWLQRRTIQPRSLITRNISSGFSWRRWNFYFVSRVESSSKFLRVDFHPKFTSRRHNFMLPCAQKRIIFWLCFKWFNNLTRTFTWCRHETLCGTKKPSIIPEL